MCPACLTTTAWLIFGGTSAGGLLTAGLAKLQLRAAPPAIDPPGGAPPTQRAALVEKP